MQGHARAFDIGQPGAPPPRQRMVAAQKQPVILVNQRAHPQVGQLGRDDGDAELGFAPAHGFGNRGDRRPAPPKSLSGWAAASSTSTSGRTEWAMLGRQAMVRAATGAAPPRARIRRPARISTSCARPAAAPARSASTTSRLVRVRSAAPRSSSTLRSRWLSAACEGSAPAPPAGKSHIPQSLQRLPVRGNQPASTTPRHTRRRSGA